MIDTLFHWNRNYTTDVSSVRGINFRLPSLPPPDRRQPSIITGSLCSQQTKSTMFHGTPGVVSQQDEAAAEIPSACRFWGSLNTSILPWRRPVHRPRGLSFLSGILPSSLHRTFSSCPSVCRAARERSPSKVVSCRGAALSWT